MFQTTGLFKELLCPIPNCDRPNCVFWHEGHTKPNAGDSVNQATSSNHVRSNSPGFYGYNAYVASDDSYNISSLYAPVEPTSMGYTGYVAPTYSGAMSAVPMNPESEYHSTMNAPSTSLSPVAIPQPMSAYSPISPEPAPFAAKPVKQEVEDDDVIIIEDVKPLEPKQSVIAKLNSLPLPKSSLQDVASIDAEIERLKKLRQQAAKDSSVGEPSPPPKPKAISVVGYTPTPLEDLRKQKEEEKRRKLEEKEKEQAKQKLREERAKEKELARKKEKEQEKEKQRKELEKEKKRKELEKAKKARKLEADLFNDDDEVLCLPAKISKIENPERQRQLQEKLFSERVKEKVKKMEKESLPPVKAAPVISKPSEAAVQMRQQEKGIGLSIDQIVAAKQRIAKPNAENVTRAIKPNLRRLPTPAEQLKARQEALAKRKAAESANNPNSKLPKTLEQIYGSKSKTSASTSSENKRMASAPSASKKNGPSLLDISNTKIPLSVRSQYLLRFYTQLCQMMPDEDALTQAAIEEKSTMDKVQHKKGYMIAAVNNLKRLRDFCESSKKAAQPKKTVSHYRCLAGKSVDLITVGANGPKKETEITEEILYSALTKHYLLSPEQLINNSYPYCKTPDSVYIEPSYYDKKKSKKVFAMEGDCERFCVRCCKEYRACPKGTPVKTTCVYHLRGKSRMPGKRRNNESTYPCCGSDDGEAGCQMADYHVSDTLRVSDLQNFVKTPKPKSENDPRSRRVYAIDCEMVYTVWGPHLARVTMVDMKEAVVLDELVKPDHFVIDYNTVFSGITESDLKNAKYSLESIRKRMFDFINAKTVLIGHSLESDMKAMKLVHNTIVDTAILFPHRTENEKKRGLKELALDKLDKVIQEDLSGHDSKEDAVTALELVLHKVKFDGKF